MEDNGAAIGDLAIGIIAGVLERRAMISAGARYTASCGVPQYPDQLSAGRFSPSLKVSLHLSPPPTQGRVVLLSSMSGLIVRLVSALLGLGDPDR